jgi:hypothetical protein
LVRPSAKISDANADEATAQVVKTVVSPETKACSAAADTITIAPGSSCRLEITVNLPANPCQYDGVLRFAQPGSSPLEAPLTFQLRVTLVFAAVTILAGLLIGWLVRVVLKNWRSRLENRGAVARIAVELDHRAAGLPGGFADDVERREYEQVRIRLSEIPDTPAAGVPQARIDELLGTMRLRAAALVPWVSPPASRLEGAGARLQGAHGRRHRTRRRHHLPRSLE